MITIQTPGPRVGTDGRMHCVFVVCGVFFLLFSIFNIFGYGFGSEWVGFDFNYKQIFDLSNCYQNLKEK